jgi:hypothetical protein
MGAADEELAGDQQLEKAARSRRGVARISARGFPKSLGNKGAGEWCATRARILAIRSQAFPGSLHFAQCGSAIARAGGGEEVLERSYAKALN